MSEERVRPSSPDSEEIEVTTDEVVDPKAARRARRAKAKLALRIPDDEIARPQETKSGANGEAAAAAAARDSEPEEAPKKVEEPPAPIQPARIISVGPPPSDVAVAEAQKTEQRIANASSAPAVSDDVSDDRLTQLDIDDHAETPIAPGVAAKSHDEDDDGIDVPVDEDEPEYRPRVPTIPSVPPPPPDAEPKADKPRQPSEDALEIDDVEAAAVLSSRPPPRKSSPPPAPTIPSVPPVPKISSKPPMPPPAAAVAVVVPPPAAPVPVAAPAAAVAVVAAAAPAPASAPALAPALAPAPAPAPAPVPLAAPAAAAAPAPAAVPSAPISPPIPADALSSTPQLEERAKPARAMQTALVDEEEARGIEEIEPDRASAPPSVDSGDEIDTSDVLAIAPVIAKGDAARPISVPPKPPVAAKPPPPVVKIPIVAPTAAAVPSPLAPPPMQDAPRRRARPWWEDLFNDDFIRTMPKFTDAQVADEVDFIEDSLGVARGGALLDLGCGTGKQAVELSRRGYKVVGFDLSLAMLARAGEEAQEHDQKINFVQGDMREMTFEDAFDGIYCWGSTFGYFEEEKNAHVIGRVHKALRQGGQFLLDVVSRDFVIAQSPSLAWFEGEGCVCMDEMSVDWITSRMRVKRTMMLDDGRSKEIEYSIRIYSLHELGKLLHDAGFRVAEVSGRIQTPGVFFGPSSPRTLILAEKR